MRTHEVLSLVCFGGGTGLPTLLRGLKRLPWVTPIAIVNVFDDGGSSGALRDIYGILPPGDILKAVLALAEDDESARNIFLTRIRHETTSIHTGGNLLLFAFEKVYGNMRDAVDALQQTLNVRGRVIPVSDTVAHLVATLDDGTCAIGEQRVDETLHGTSAIASLRLNPSVIASPDAIHACGTADAFIVGPGSFYTSQLPNFLPVGIVETIRASPAPIILICNCLTEGETMLGMTPTRIATIFEGMVGRRVTTLVVNDAIPSPDVLTMYATEGKFPILPDDDPRVVAADLWVDSRIARHDSDRLATLVEHIVRVARSS